MSAAEIEPYDSEGLARLRERHVSDMDPIRAGCTWLKCGQVWPCPTARLLATLDQSTAAVVAERDAWVEVVLPGNRESDMGKDARAEGPSYWAGVQEEANALIRESVEITANAYDQVDEMITSLRSTILADGWLVWSCEHEVWWKPNSCGYTARIDEAGRYSLADARARCKMRSPRASSKPDEVAVPSPELLAVLLGEEAKPHGSPLPTAAAACACACHVAYPKGMPCGSCAKRGGFGAGIVTGRSIRVVVEHPRAGQIIREELNRG